MEKSVLRRQVIEKIRALSEQERQLKGIEIKQQLESLKVFKEAERILFYFSHDGEVDTLKLMEKWMGQKKLFLPRLDSDNTFLPVPLLSMTDLKPNLFGILEPPFPLDKEILKPDFDLIIVPGVAFDQSGNRLGRGKGFYDRFLQRQKKVPKVALAYNEQILDRVPKEPYDEPVDMIVTEKEIIRCHFSL